MADRRQLFKTSLPGAPAPACRGAVLRGARRKPGVAKEILRGFLARDKDGEVDARAIQPGFSPAVCDAKDRRAPVPSKSAFPA